MLYISFDAFDINLLTLKGDLILILQWTFILIGSSSVAFFSHIFCDWWNAEDKKMGIIEGFPRKTKINENFILLTEVKKEVKKEGKEEGKEVKKKTPAEIDAEIKAKFDAKEDRVLYILLCGSIIFWIGIIYIIYLHLHYPEYRIQ